MWKLKVGLRLRGTDRADVYLEDTFLAGPLLLDEAKAMIREWVAKGEVDCDLPNDEAPAT